jgi:diaminopimelate epimerase
MRRLIFEKYEGLRNDFVIVNGRELNAWGRAEANLLPLGLRIAMCDRNAGIGADGVLTLLPPTDERALIRMHVTNSDGSVPEMCGNGLRCVAKWLDDQGLLPSQGALIETDAGMREVMVKGRSVHADMGLAQFTDVADSAAFPGGRMAIKGLAGQGAISVNATPVSMGNPHLVIEHFADGDLAAKVGAELSVLEAYPNGTNVEFIEILGHDQVRVVVYERGVGLTQACGTGACAVAAALVKRGRVTPGVPVGIHLPGGLLLVEVNKPAPEVADFGFPVRMMGPARRVYQGELDLDELAAEQLRNRRG